MCEKRYSHTPGTAGQRGAGGRGFINRTSICRLGVNTMEGDPASDPEVTLGARRTLFGQGPPSAESLHPEGDEGEGGGDGDGVRVRVRVRSTCQLSGVPG